MKVASILSVLCFTWLAVSPAQDQQSIDTFLEETADTTDPKQIRVRAHLLQRRGEQRFFEADIAGALEDFDEVIRIAPESDPHNWQRGIALYYAERYQEGKEQFERHQTVNSQDVENAVWHFFCAVRAPGGSVESARKDLIPISGDTRVPMSQVHDLFAGEGTVEAVLAAARAAGDPETSSQAKNAMLYAHLYLAIYYEAIGQDEKMQEHIDLASGKYRVDHYMGKVAQVHALLRGREVNLKN